jgi:hypothetical protein
VCVKAYRLPHCADRGERDVLIHPYSQEERVADGRAMGAFKAMGATQSELNSERVRLKCDDAYTDRLV